MRNLSRVALGDKVLKALELKRDPFLPPRKLGDIFYGHDAAQVDVVLWDAVLRPGICAIIGEVGSGKSLAVERFRQHELLTKNQYAVSQVALHRPDQMGPHHLCKQVLFDLMGDMHQYKELVAINTSIRKNLFELADKGVRPVAIIEDAHLLPWQTLRDVKTLYEMTDRIVPLIGIVLVGQPELQAKLAQQNLRQVAQRCRVYQMQGLRTDLSQYVRHLFQRAGVNGGDYFDPESFKVLQDHPGVCTPLEVNHVCTLALGLKWKNSEERVTRELMLEALSLRDGNDEIDLPVATARPEQATPAPAQKKAVGA